MSETLLITLGSIVLLVTIITAFIIMQGRKSSRKHKDKLNLLYRKIISNDDLNISDDLVLENKIFAIDTDKKIFVFVYNYGEPVFDIIQLNGIKSCMVRKTGPGLITSKNGKSVTDTHINEIHLSFLMGEHAIVDIPVYREIHDGLSEYLHILTVASDWRDKINKLIQLQDH